MKTVWKYVLKPNELSLDIPIGASVLSTGTQGEDICLWVLADPHEPTESRDFFVAGTGHPVPDKYQPPVFIGTVHMNALVFHVFELTIR